MKIQCLAGALFRRQLSNRGFTFPIRVCRLWLCCESFTFRRAKCGKSARCVLWEPEPCDRLRRPSPGEGRFLRATRLVCAFALQADAERVYQVLASPLQKFGLEVAAEKRNLIRFRPDHWRASGAFEFLGFEFRWGRGRWGKPVLKSRTARKKYGASLASFQDRCRKHCGLSKAVLFAKLDAKLRGRYQHYGIHGNFASLADFYHHAQRLLFRTLNRRCQRRSYNWKGFAA